ncbi:MAG TPA: BatA domain-containing protein, partial [Rhizomicrobium sp.]|nr:BatA domain-containing protein [Rhizomicrobium sp.]
MTFLNTITFATPWILFALIALPAIWFLLRVTPPSPKRVLFPPLRLLLGLAAPQETPARTPWWLLLLRLLAAGLVVAALAGPSIGEAPKAAGHGPLVLFVDNGWTAAHAWSDREAAISDALAGASRAGRAVAIVPTAAGPSVTLLAAGEAERTARELEPQSWLPNRARAAAALAKARLVSPEILWLSDGLDYGDAQTTADALGKLGHLTIVADAPGKTPLALKPEKNEADGFGVTVIRAGTSGARGGDVSAIGAHGEVLASAPFRFAPGARETAAKISLPLE